MILYCFDIIISVVLLGMNETTVAFLEKLSNRTTKGTSEEIQKRVTHSTSIIRRLVITMEKTIQRTNDVITTLNKKV